MFFVVSWHGTEVWMQFPPISLFLGSSVMLTVNSKKWQLFMPIWLILTRSNPPLKSAGDFPKIVNRMTCVKPIKHAIEKTKRRLKNPTFIGFTWVMQLDTIWGKSPALFNGGLLLGNNDHMQFNLFIYHLTLLQYYLNFCWPPPRGGGSQLLET